jgi:hypothetical protein
MEFLMPDFVQGLLVALLPSMLTVGWLVWRAWPVDELGSLDQHRH